MQRQIESPDVVPSRREWSFQQFSTFTPNPVNLIIKLITQLSACSRSICQFASVLSDIGSTFIFSNICIHGFHSSMPLALRNSWPLRRLLVSLNQPLHIKLFCNLCHKAANQIPKHTHTHISIPVGTFSGRKQYPAPYPHPNHPSDPSKRIGL